MNAKVLAASAAVLLFLTAPDIASAARGGGRGGGHGGGHGGGRWSGGHFHSGFRGHGHGGHFHGGHFHGGHFHGKPFHGGRLHGHLHGGVFVANPWWWSAPYYGAPAVYGGYRAYTYWYCQSAGAYYPYVLTCPEPWIPVVP